MAVLLLACGTVAAILAAGPLRILPGPRTSGPLPISIQKEVDASIDRGRAWLIARQEANGSWLGSNRIDLTAAAWLSLSADRSAAGTSALARAWDWLAARTNETEHVWLRLARAVHDNHAEEALLASRDLRAIQERSFSDEPARDDWVLLWLDTRLRNREPDATKLDPGDAQEGDWRVRKARQIVNAQLAAPEQPGAGFWRSAREDPADWQSQPVAQTSFALLVLQEL